ncbi:MAG: DUF805 domain-containing protein [Nitratireductor sp.]
MKPNTPPNLKWLFFSYRGRIARKSFILAQILLLIVLSWIIYKIVQYEDLGLPTASWGLVLFGAGLVSLYATFCLVLKRLHDLNWHPAFIICAFIPTLNFLFALVLMLLPSFNDSNKHGPPPFGKK